MMFQHLLVLLDGSGRAELALPVAVRLAHATDASITLVRMMTLPTDFTWSKLEPPFWDREILATERREASTYLKRKAWELELAGIAVQTHLLPGLAFPQMQALIEHEQIDLVLLCSRGRISLRSHTQNSMAWRMIQQCPVPMLVLHETIDQQGTLSYRNTPPVQTMILLDGSALAETVLVPAARLAAALSAPEPGRLHLVNVLPFAASSQTQEKIDVLQARVWNDRCAYLQAAARLLCEGEMKPLKLSITTAVLAGPEVVQTLFNATERKTPEETACNILAFTTHGHSGLSHPRIGRMAEHLFQETLLPLLVVHPSPGKQPTSQEKVTALTSPEGMEA